MIITLSTGRALYETTVSLLGIAAPGERALRDCHCELGLTFLWVMLWITFVVTVDYSHG